MESVRVRLVKMESSDPLKEFVYSVEHNNGKTTLESPVFIMTDDVEYTASLRLEDFPPQNSAQDAALKLAEWLERIAKAIKHGEFYDVKTADWKDFD